MFACLLLPAFPLQAALRWRSVEFSPNPKNAGTHPTSPYLAIIDPEEGVVIEATPEAFAKGVATGMTSSQAMAREKNLTLLPRSAAQEECLDRLLLETAFSLSPEVEHTVPGACLADLHRAPRHLCWQKLGDRVVARMSASGLRLQVGVASTPDLAFLAARGASPVSIIYNPGEFAAELPIEALDPSSAICELLREWGIRTVGEFLTLPKAETIARLGREAEALFQRVSGRNKRLLRLVRPSPDYIEAFDFEYEVETTEPLLFLLRRFLEALCGRLREAHRVAERLVLTIPLEDATAYERSFAIPAPTAEVEILYRILDTHLEGLQLEQRPVGIRLKISPSLPMREQLDLFAAALRDPNQFGQTLARLKAFLGNDHVGVPAQKDSHQPGTWVLHETFPEKPSRPHHLPRGLPLRRYRPALPVQVRREGSDPAYVESPAVRGEVADCAGPYRLFGNWWDQERWSLEEWDIELAQGGLFRLSRRGSIWKLEGCYEVESITA